MQKAGALASAGLEQSSFRLLITNGSCSTGCASSGCRCAATCDNSSRSRRSSRSRHRRTGCRRHKCSRGDSGGDGDDRNADHRTRSGRHGSCVRNSDRRSSGDQRCDRRSCAHSSDHYSCRRRGEPARRRCRVSRFGCECGCCCQRRGLDGQKHHAHGSHRRQCEGSHHTERSPLTVVFPRRLPTMGFLRMQFKLPAGTNTMNACS